MQACTGSLSVDASVLRLAGAQILGANTNSISEVTPASGAWSNLADAAGAKPCQAAGARKAAARGQAEGQAARRERQQEAAQERRGSGA